MSCCTIACAWLKTQAIDKQSPLPATPPLPPKKHLCPRDVWYKKQGFAKLLKTGREEGK